MVDEYERYIKSEEEGFISKRKPEADSCSCCRIYFNPGDWYKKFVWDRKDKWIISSYFCAFCNYIRNACLENKCFSENFLSFNVEEHALEKGIIEGNYRSLKFPLFSNSFMNRGQFDNAIQDFNKRFRKEKGGSKNGLKYIETLKERIK